MVISSWLHCEANEFQDVRAVLFGVLALYEGIVDADTFRHRAWIDHLAGRDQVLDLQPCKALVGVAQGAGNGFQLVLREERHVGPHLP